MITIIYIGGNSVLRKREIIGIFDIDSITVYKKSRDFLENAEEDGNVEYASMYDLPRTAVLTDEKVYITPTASATIERRVKKY